MEGVANYHQGTMLELNSNYCFAHGCRSPAAWPKVLRSNDAFIPPGANVGNAVTPNTESGQVPGGRGGST